MSNLKFIEEQQNIIDTNDKNIIVSASAGSGKTTVMVAKICDLIIRKKAKVKELIVLTYTTAAATEMKERLYKKLQEYSLTYEFLEDEIEDVSTAEISTIHSFCQRLLKKNFHFASLDPSFEVLDGQSATLFKKKAIQNIFEKFKKENSDNYFLLLKNYGKNRTDQKIINLIYEINEFFNSIADKNEYKQKNAFYLYNNPDKALQIINVNICDNINYIKTSFENLLNSCAKVDATDYIKVINEIISIISQISYNRGFYQNLQTLLEAKLPTFKKRDEYDSELTEQIFNLKTDLSTFISNQKQKNYTSKENLEKSFESGKQILNILLDLEDRFEKEYSQIKKQNNSLDFSDLEKKAILLTSKPEVAFEIKNQYKYIFVDEFQDANEVQEKLLQNISGPNNRFVVGDIKQSIYGFRNSNPDIFLELEQKYSNDSLSKSMNLKTNFRSEKKIVDFVNFVFEKIMTEKTAKVDYKNKAKLINFLQNNQSENPKVKVTIFESKKRKEKQTPNQIYSVKTAEEQDEESSEAEEEAIKVAEDILRYKNSFIYENNQKRPVKFSDITILISKRWGGLEKFSNKLSSLGVPIFASSSQNLFEQIDCQKLIWLLTLSQNFNNDFELVGVMVSPFAKFTFEELAQIRLSYKTEPFFYDCVLKYKVQKTDYLAKKISGFAEFLQDFKNDIEVNGIYIALTNALSKSDYINTILPQADGQQRLASIEKFKNLFNNTKFNRDVFGFLNYIEVQNGEVESPNIFVGDNDFVNISTIHASKGLEYPIVFLVNTGDLFFNGNSKEEIETNQTLGVGLKFLDEEENQKYSSPVYESIKIENKDKDFAETLRLLYVALTRAKNHLNIYGTISTKFLSSLKNDYEIKAQNSYIKLILGCLPQEKLETLKQNKKVNLFEDEDFEFCLVDEQTKKEELVRQNILFGKPDEKMEKYFLDNLNFKYNNPEVFEIALKNSVSSLAFNDDYQSVNLSPQKLTLEEHLSFDNQAAEKGTLYHEVFEKIDFDKNITYQQFIERLKDTFDTKTYEMFETEKLYNAFILVSSIFDKQTVFKEKKFIMKVAYNQIVESNIDQEVLVQGVIDAFCVKNDKVILVDYKLSKTKDTNVIKQRYFRQISLYKKALSIRYNVKEVEGYIVLINSGELVKM